MAENIYDLDPEYAVTVTVPAHYVINVDFLPSAVEGMGDDEIIDLALVHASELSREMWTAGGIYDGPPGGENAVRVYLDDDSTGPVETLMRGNICYVYPTEAEVRRPL